MSKSECRKEEAEHREPSCVPLAVPVLLPIPHRSRNGRVVRRLKNDDSGLAGTQCVHPRSYKMTASMVRLPTNATGTKSQGHRRPRNNGPAKREPTTVNSEAGTSGTPSQLMCAGINPTHFSGIPMAQPRTSPTTHAQKPNRRWGASDSKSPSDVRLSPHICFPGFDEVRICSTDRVSTAFSNASSEDSCECGAHNWLCRCTCRLLTEAEMAMWLVDRRATMKCDESGASWAAGRLSGRKSAHRNRRRHWRSPWHPPDGEPRSVSIGLGPSAGGTGLTRPAPAEPWRFLQPRSVAGRGPARGTSASRGRGRAGRG